MITRGWVKATALVLAAALVGCGGSSGSERAEGDGAAGREARSKGFEGRRAQTFVGAKEICEIEPRSEFAVSEGLPARSGSAAIARAYAAEWPGRLRRAALEGCRAGLANVPARFPASSPKARDIWERHFIVTSASGEDDDPPLARPLHIQISFSSERDHTVGWQGSCNSIGGDVRFTANEMRVGELGSTLIGCETEVEEEDRWLSDFMSGRPEWRLDGERLRLVTDEARLELRGSEDPDTCLISPDGSRVDLGNSGLSCEGALNFAVLHLEGKDRYLQGVTCHDAKGSDTRTRVICREGKKWFAVYGFDPASFEMR
jgi:heat shock protein HslJ